MVEKKKIAVVFADAAGSVCGGYDAKRLFASTGWEAERSG